MAGDSGSEADGAGSAGKGGRNGSADATGRAADSKSLGEAGARTSEAMAGANVRSSMAAHAPGALQGAADTLDPNDDPDTVDRAMNGLDSFNGTPESRAAAADAEAAAQVRATPLEDPVMQRMREDVAIQLGQAQGRQAAAGGWISDMADGVAEAVETGYEMAVAGIEDVTGLIANDYAARQRADLQARADGLAAAAQEAIDNPEALARALAESYETRFAAADALERAYRDGYADLSVLQESARMRAEAEAELTILGVETAGTVIGAGAIAKGLRALDVAEDLADSNLGTLIANRAARDGAVKAVADDLATETAPAGKLTVAEVRQRIDTKLARRTPGIATGTGVRIDGDWLRESIRTGTGAPIPDRIAAKLAGRDFNTFDDFRESFWQEVAADAELAVQFDEIKNLPRLRAGKPPIAPRHEHQGKTVWFELDHIEPLFKGGPVYDMDNLQVLTPRAHTRKSVEERK
ncbi:HNH endonuclease [Paracoccus alkanivorans]|uniref:HNH endonuclease n=1 Tax=Paracoccus alkanivorans TaxID=2116655 RepID=A0A3M0M9V3_9RHOB|nr:HNH endonuclease [Paracoccus alkanivorans]RMC34439.1 HNH endonuclease [Paracoccus alkanivorans]